VMRGFVQGADRQQTTLLPECLDDWVGESNSTRMGFSIHTTVLFEKKRTD
jgi:hypothetical protein